MRAGSAARMSLQQAYEAALKNDPAYRMNFYENESARKTGSSAAPACCRTSAASYSASRNRADQTVPDCPAWARQVATHPNYISRSAVLQLRQPLFNLEALARYRQGVAQTKQSAAQFEANTGEVALRVVGAYVDALFAEDQLALAQAQRDMYLEQQKVNERLFEKGEGTKTDMLETQARLDLAEAQLLEAQDNLTAARNTLEGVVGMEVGTLDNAGAGLPCRRVSAGQLRRMEGDRAGAQPRPEGGASRGRSRRGRKSSKARAGHAPRARLRRHLQQGRLRIASTPTTRIRSTAASACSSTFRSIRGGAVNAATRQAVARHERAKADLRCAHQQGAGRIAQGARPGAEQRGARSARWTRRSTRASC